MHSKVVGCRLTSKRGIALYELTLGCGHRRLQKNAIVVGASTKCQACTLRRKHLAQSEARDG